MSIVEVQTRQKQSEANRLRWQDLEYREMMSKKISEGLKNKPKSKEHRRNLSVALTGYRHNESARRNMSESRRRGLLKLSKETRKKMSEIAMKRFSIPENHPNWQGGISFEPYSPEFNDRLRERIRNRDNRVCVLCGKPEILNGRRLVAHHIDGNKMNSDPSNLAALCCSCNSSKDTIGKEFLIVTNSVTGAAA